MRATIISGSARENNNSIRVAKALLKLLEKKHTASIIDFRTYDIPLMAQGGLNKNKLSDFQKNLIENLSESNIIIMVSPEYNWSITPELLNMFDIFGEVEFKKLFNNKIFAFVGVSSGKGGKAPCLHLMQISNKIIGYTQSHSVVSAKIFESHFTNNMLDEDGNFTETGEYENGLKAFVNYTLTMAEIWFR